jgi:hypothetical protein
MYLVNNIDYMPELTPKPDLTGGEIYEKKKLKFACI